MESQQSIAPLVEMWLGRGGLFLDLLGATFLYWGGTQPTWTPPYAWIAPDDFNPEEDERRYELKARRWRTLSRIGLALLGMGFALQLIGTFARG